MLNAKRLIKLNAKNCEGWFGSTWAKCEELWRLIYLESSWINFESTLSKIDIKHGICSDSSRCSAKSNASKVVILNINTMLYYINIEVGDLHQPVPFRTKIHRINIARIYTKSVCQAATEKTGSIQSPRQRGTLIPLVSLHKAPNTGVETQEHDVDVQRADRL